MYTCTPAVAITLILTPIVWLPYVAHVHWCSSSHVTVLVSVHNCFYQIRYEDAFAEKDPCNACLQTCDLSVLPSEVASCLAVTKLAAMGFWVMTHQWSYSWYSSVSLHNIPFINWWVPVRCGLLTVEWRIPYYHSSYMKLFLHWNMFYTCSERIVLFGLLIL